MLMGDRFLEHGEINHDLHGHLIALACNILDHAPGNFGLYHEENRLAGDSEGEEDYDYLMWHSNE